MTIIVKSSKADKINFQNKQLIFGIMTERLTEQYMRLFLITKGFITKNFSIISENSSRKILVSSVQ